MNEDCFDDKEAIAKHYANKTCGNLHIGWVIDHYWGLITKDYILPACLAVYDQLVIGKNKEDSPFYTHDDQLFFIEIDKKYKAPPGVVIDGKKVFVWKTQNKHFLFIIKGQGNNADLYIRRVWEKFDPSKHTLSINNLKDAINNLETLSKFSDDDCKYVERPSIEKYSANNFQIPFVPKNHINYFCSYGDSRDPGHILGFKSYLKDVEDSTTNFKTIEYIATCLIPFILREMGINSILPPKGYSL